MVGPVGIEVVQAGCAGAANGCDLNAGVMLGANSGTRGYRIARGADFRPPCSGEDAAAEELVTAVEGHDLAGGERALRSGAGDLSSGRRA